MPVYMRWWRGNMLVAALAALPLLAACDGQKTATGQVIAVVNGEEVTVGELNLEARERGIANPNDKAVRDGLVREIISRKLLAQAAAKRGLDRSPEHILSVERAGELLLANKEVAALNGANEAVTQADEEAFAKARPLAFDARMAFMVDQIVFPRPQDPQVVRSLAAAQSLDAIITILQQAGIQMQRSNAMWDSGRMPATAAEQLRSLRAGEPFVILSGDPSVAGVVLGRRPNRLPEQQRRALAREGIANERNQKALESWLAQAFASAKIQYQQGFAPSGKEAQSSATK